MPFAIFPETDICIYDSAAILPSLVVGHCRNVEALSLSLPRSKTLLLIFPVGLLNLLYNICLRCEPMLCM